MLPAVESRPAGTVSPVAHISGHVRIAAPVERVFDTAADSRNEPSFNPAMSEMLSGIRHKHSLGYSVNRTSRKILVRLAAMTTTSSGLFSSGPLK